MCDSTIYISLVPRVVIVRVKKVLGIHNIIVWGDVMKWLVTIFGCIAFGLDVLSTALNADQNLVCIYNTSFSSYQPPSWQIHILKISWTNRTGGYGPVCDKWAHATTNLLSFLWFLSH